MPFQALLTELTLIVQDVVLHQQWSQGQPTDFQEQGPLQSFEAPQGWLQLQVGAIPCVSGGHLGVAWTEAGLFHACPGSGYSQQAQCKISLFSPVEVQDLNSVHREHG